MEYCYVYNNISDNFNIPFFSKKKLARFRLIGGLFDIIWCRCKELFADTCITVMIHLSLSILMAWCETIGFFSCYHSMFDLLQLFSWCQYISLLTLVRICFRSFSEEAGELIQTLLENEEKSRTASEMADLLYHAMVLLSVRDVKMEEVLEVLRKRFSQSGVEEKASRKKS